MDEKLFSKESLEKIKSPEMLNDYIKVSRPHSWVVVIIIFLTILIFLIWANFCVLDIQLDTVVVSRPDIIYTIVNKEDIMKIDVGREVRVDENSLKISNIGKYNEELNGYIVYLEGNLPQGNYDGKIILESIHALKLYLN